MHTMQGATNFLALSRANAGARCVAMLQCRDASKQYHTDGNVSLRDSSDEPGASSNVDPRPSRRRDHAPLPLMRTCPYRTAADCCIHNLVKQARYCRLHDRGCRDFVIFVSYLCLLTPALRQDANRIGVPHGGGIPVGAATRTSDPCFAGAAPPGLFPAARVDSNARGVHTR